jgi:Cu/Ag efflux protein CusF
MKSKILAVCLAAAFALPAVTLAQQPAAKPTVTAVPGKGITATDTVEGRATITAIDAKTRTVTLKSEKGEVFDVEAGAEVKNFDKLKVGDVVVATYTQSIAARIAAPSEGAVPGVKESVSGTPAAGQRKLGHEVTATLKVDAVDAKANKVTLSDGAGHSRVVDVVNPKVQERLKTLKPGEMVVVTYSESLAIRLEKAPAK